jgi:hypothetical protein
MLQQLLYILVQHRMIFLSLLATACSSLCFID